MATSLSLKTTKFKRHITLTGFMGSGKTTVGRILAQRLQLPFLDTDEKLKEKTGLSSSQYIDRFGIEGFRMLESHQLHNTLREPPMVIATGGGIILEPINQRQINEKSINFWLNSSMRILMKRLSTCQKERPLLRQASAEQINKLYSRRLHLYRNAHFEIDTNFRKPEDVATIIEKKCGEILWNGKLKTVASLI